MDMLEIQNRVNRSGEKISSDYRSLESNALECFLEEIYTGLEEQEENDRTA